MKQQYSGFESSSKLTMLNLIFRSMLAVAVLSMVVGCGKTDDAAVPAVPAGAEQAPAAAEVASQPAGEEAPQSETVTVSAPVLAEDLLATKTVDELLSLGSAALADQRLAAPAGDNAVEYYLAVRAKEPNNSQATQALVDIFPMAANFAERQVAQRELDEADRILSMLEQVSPGSYTVSTLRSKLDTAHLALEREQEAAATRQAQLASAAAAAAAAAAAPEPAAAPPAAASVTPAATAAAASATANKPAPTVQAVAQPKPPTGETRGPLVLRQVEPQFPIQAARRRQSGWVDIEYTVDATGKTSEIKVAASQPSRVFDRAAISAVEQWSYQPALKDGQPVEHRLSRRLEFQL